MVSVSADLLTESSPWQSVHGVTGWWLISRGCQGSKACTEQGLVHCFPLAPFLCRWKTKPVKSGSCGCSALLALPALQSPVFCLELRGAGGPGSAGLCGVRRAPQSEVGGPWVLGVCPTRDEAVVLLGLISGKWERGKEGRSIGGSVLFFTPCSSPVQGPRCLDGTPPAQLWPRRAGTNLPVPTALAADQGEGPTPCVHY